MSFDPESAAHTDGWLEGQAEERERCAKVAVECMNHPPRDAGGRPNAFNMALLIAEAIRTGQDTWPKIIREIKRKRRAGERGA